MKQVTSDRKKKHSISDDENVKYKLNTQYFNNVSKSKTKSKKKDDDDDGVRYKLAPIASKPKTIDKKPKPKPKIKVNFWSQKHIMQRNKKTTPNIKDSKRRYTVGTTDNTDNNKQKIAVDKVRKRVSFLPSPVFTENHVPMVTVPDDLTMQLNAAKDQALGDDLIGYVHNEKEINKLHDQGKKKSRTSMTQTSPRSSKGASNKGNENELEFFSNYVVQKLRRMETNQRIYSENLINTALMLGQLGKLNGKSKIGEHWY